MWISNRISREDRLKKREVSSADVTISESKNLILQNSNEYREIKIVSPRGISYVPVQGDKMVVVPVGDENICIGAIQEEKDIEAGELMLYSSGGAKIILKNNGQVVINSTVIPAVGGWLWILQ